MKDQVKLFRPLMDEGPVNLGIPEQDIDDILEIGDAIATFDPNVIVYVQGPVLQEWR